VFVRLLKRSRWPSGNPRQPRPAFSKRPGHPGEEVDTSAAEIGISNGTLNNHFPSRRADRRLPAAPPAPGADPLRQAAAHQIARDFSGPRTCIRREPFRVCAFVMPWPSSGPPATRQQIRAHLQTAPAWFRDCSAARASPIPTAFLAFAAAGRRGESPPPWCARSEPSPALLAMAAPRAAGVGGGPPSPALRRCAALRRSLTLVALKPAAGRCTS